MDARSAGYPHCQETPPRIELDLHAGQGARSSAEAITSEPIDHSQAPHGDARRNDAAVTVL